MKESDINKCVYQPNSSLIKSVILNHNSVPTQKSDTDLKCDKPNQELVRFCVHSR